MATGTGTRGADKRPAAELTASEQAVRQTAERYARMAQASPDAITLRSLPDRRYIEVNDGFSKLTGYSAEEVIGKTSGELNLFVDSVPHETALQNLRNKGEVREEEFRFRTKSGEIRWGRVSAVPVTMDGRDCMLSVTHDITDQKRAEEALRQSAADLRSLVEGAPFGIYRVDFGGHIHLANPALARMLGYASPEDLQGRNLADIYSDPAAGNQSILENWGTQGFWELDTEWKRQDGRPISVRLTGRYVPNSSQDAAYLEVFAEDVTERRNLERQFLQSQKMDAIGRLAGGVAHDFNNLLSVILGHAEILGQRLTGDDRFGKSVDAVQQAAERAAALTSQLLAFSRKQVVAPKVIDLNLAVREMQKLVRRILSEDIEVILRLQPDLGLVKIDPGQLDQVLMNLAVNSRDAMPDGGRLVIETANVELDDTYVRQHLGAQIGSYVRLLVSDTGKGMDASVMAHIFEPFFTTKEKGKGTGLGLSTVYGIVKQAGGYVMAYSEPGDGTTFRIYLPRTDQAASVREERRLLDEIPGGSETILVVEDETALRQLARTLLEESGYRVFDAANAQEALAIARDPENHIDLVLTDVVMPHMSGRELADQLSAARPNLRVIYMSGYADDVISHRGVLLAGATLLLKPFTRRVLLTKIRESLDAKT